MALSYGMGIQLHVKPGPGISRATFVATHAPFSIALDGYVEDAPFLDLAGPFRNFNHHEVVDRSCTTATCEQARRGVLLGLYDLFADRGGRRAELWVNDCDQDVCLATWILMNPDRAAEPLVRQLTQIEDLLDSSSGTFPLPHERDLLAEVRWVFDPYARARPRITGMTAAEMQQVIADVHLRIEQFVIGRAGHVALEGEYRRIGGNRWWLVEVDRPQARERMVAAGVRAAVELTARHGDRYTYSLWRRSEYIAWFPIRDILAALNAAEGDPRTTWGGADTVGGSPRGVGSRIPPDEVERVVESVVAAAKPDRS
jgi:hypothetical protein